MTILLIIHTLSVRYFALRWVRI